MGRVQVRTLPAKVVDHVRIVDDIDQLGTVQIRIVREQRKLVVGEVVAAEQRHHDRHCRLSDGRPELQDLGRPMGPGARLPGRLDGGAEMLVQQTAQFAAAGVHHRQDGSDEAAGRLDGTGQAQAQSPDLVARTDLEVGGAGRIRKHHQAAKARLVDVSQAGFRQMRPHVGARAADPLQGHRILLAAAAVDDVDGLTGIGVRPPFDQDARVRNGDDAFGEHPKVRTFILAFEQRRQVGNRALDEQDQGFSPMAQAFLDRQLRQERLARGDTIRRFESAKPRGQSALHVLGMAAQRQAHGSDTGMRAVDDVQIRSGGRHRGRK